MRAPRWERRSLLVPGGAVGQMVKELNRNPDEVRLLIRRKDMLPVYAVGDMEPLPDSALGGDNAGMLQWLAAQGFDPLTQSALYWQLDGDAPEANTMHIRVQDASLGWNTAALDEKIAACFIDVEPGEYTRVCRLIERTIYGGDAPDLREERAMQSFLFKLAASAREEPLHTRLRLRYTCPLSDWSYKQNTVICHSG